MGRGYSELVVISKRAKSIEVPDGFGPPFAFVFKTVFEPLVMPHDKRLWNQ